MHMSAPGAGSTVQMSDASDNCLARSLARPLAAAAAACMHVWLYVWLCACGCACVRRRRLTGRRSLRTSAAASCRTTSRACWRTTSRCGPCGPRCVARAPCGGLWGWGMASIGIASQRSALRRTRCASIHMDQRGMHACASPSAPLSISAAAREGACRVQRAAAARASQPVSQPGSQEVWGTIHSHPSASQPGVPPCASMREAPTQHTPPPCTHRSLPARRP